MAYVLLAFAQGIGLTLIPFSSAGIWLQLGALAAFSWWTGFEPIGVIPLLILFALGLSTELVSAPLPRDPGAARIRRRLGVAGVAGASLGAAVGIPLPLLGSMFGAFVGAAVVTTIAAFTQRSRASVFSTLGGQVIVMAFRGATGVVIALFSILTLWR